MGHVRLFSPWQYNVDKAAERLLTKNGWIVPSPDELPTGHELRHMEQGLYIVGMKSYGRAPTFLMATGYEQVRSVVAFLVVDLEAALKVELDLPETGVCSVNRQQVKVVVEEKGDCSNSCTN
ncbi:hypothetical protein AB9M62_41810 [Bacillales bacterium AN1005]